MRPEREGSCLASERGANSRDTKPTDKCIDRGISIIRHPNSPFTKAGLYRCGVRGKGDRPFRPCQNQVHQVRTTMEPRLKTGAV